MKQCGAGVANGLTSFAVCVIKIKDLNCIILLKYQKSNLHS
jgi:hypothetical protein